MGDETEADYHQYHQDRVRQLITQHLMHLGLYDLLPAFAIECVVEQLTDWKESEESAYMQGVLDTLATLAGAVCDGDLTIQQGEDHEFHDG